MLIINAPGQGSQKPGMLIPWLDAPGVRDTLAELSDACGLDLLHLGTEANQEQITDTAVTQPLVVASALIAFECVQAQIQLPSSTMTSGHSIGEVAALAIAGVITPLEAVKLASIRGAAMAKACALQPTGMSACLGGEEAEVVEAIEQAGLTAANRNCPGQIVAAGSTAGLEALAANPPAKTRVRALAVAGAFHTQYMKPAAEEVAEHINTLTPKNPSMTLLSNADGASVSSGSTALERIVSQITQPVRWDLCQASMNTCGVDTFVELPPAGALTNMSKRTLPKEIQRIALSEPSNVDELTTALSPQREIRGGA